MAEPRDREVYGAFLKQLNETGRDFLIVGEAAAMRYEIRHVNKLEVWVNQSLHPFEQIWVMGQTWKALKELGAEVDPLELKNKVQIHRELAGLRFEDAHARGESSRLFGEPGKVLSGMDQVTAKLQAGDMEGATALIRRINGYYEAGRGYKGPDLDGSLPDLRVVPKQKP